MTIQRRKHKIKNSYGITDFFRYYKKNYKSPIKDLRKYSDILKAINHEFANELAESGYDIKFPKHMGMLSISKRKGVVWINKEGKLCSNRPIDYVATNKLWKDNPEAKKQKRIIRLENPHSDGYQFRIYYKRRTANYKNKKIYAVQFNRQMSRKFAKSIRDGKIDTVYEHKMRPYNNN